MQTIKRGDVTPMTSELVEFTDILSLSGDTAYGASNSKRENTKPECNRVRVARYRHSNVGGLGARMMLHGAEGINSDGGSGRKAHWIALLLVSTYLLVGVVFFRYIESWSVIDCVYYSMIIVTTIGYGDVTPRTAAGKAFTILFALYGICTIAIALGRLATWFVIRERAITRKATQKLLKKVDHAAIKAQSKLGDTATRKECLSTLHVTRKAHKGGWYRCLASKSTRAIASALTPFIMSIFGGIILGHMEGWPILDCLYYTIVTITTIGFGDYSPKSNGGRLFAIFYLPFSVIAVAHGIGAVIEEINRRAVMKKKISMKELLAMDADGDGQVSQVEYLSYMLVKMNKVEQDDIDRILTQFRKLDRDSSGVLDKNDLERLDQELQKTQCD